MFLLRDKLITQGENQEALTKNWQRNNVARQVEGFCISYFAAFTLKGSGNNLKVNPDRRFNPTWNVYKRKS